MAVNFLYLSAILTVVSFVGFQWWVFSLVDGIKADGLIDGGEINLKNAKRALELVLGSKVTVALLVNSVVNLFAFLVISLKTLFFVQLYPPETRKVLERLVNYVIHKGLFFPLVVPPNTFQTVLWSSWLIILCTLEMFRSLARDRLDQLNASPTATPSKYFRVFSCLLLVLVADTLWIRLCMKIYRSFTSNLFLLLFFEPLSIAFEILQAIMVHGFQLIEIWQRHSVNYGADCLGSLTLFKSASGSLSEWKSIMIRNCGFLLDMLTLSMSLGHYLIIWWLHGMAFHLVDAVLLLNFRALAGATVKRIRGYIRLRRALNSLNGALPDATYEELSAFDDECAICRGPMARAKKLSCNHLFHLSCLRSWLDQGMTDVYSCPTCRRPFFLSNLPDSASSTPVQGRNNDRLIEEVSMGLHGHPLPVGLLPNQQQNPSVAMWRGGTLESSWVPSWPITGMDTTATSSSVRSVGLSGVQLMMRQLTSVREGYAQGSQDNTAAWNLWPTQQASASSSVPQPSSSSASLRFNRNASGLRFRNTSPTVNGNNIPEINEMVDRVREVLPHIPDDVIIEDLRRTNNINITVNNLLLVQ